MPSNKTFVVLIIAIGFIVSIWLIQRHTINSTINTFRDNSSIEAVRTTNNSVDGEWSKILVSVISDSSSAGKTTIPKNNSEVFDETTLTAQMARDLFSRYLLVAKKGQNLSEAEMTKIADDVLASPEYTKSSGVLYLESDLRITQKRDKTTLDNYKTTLNQYLATGIKSIENKGNVATIVNAAIVDGDEKKLVELEPFVTAFRIVTSELLKMEVPSTLAPLHLKLLNTSSNLTANIEAMRGMLYDPVKGFIGANKFSDNFAEFEVNLENINTYFKVNP